MFRAIVSVLRNFFQQNRVYVEDYSRRKNTQVDGRFYTEYAGRTDDPLGALTGGMKPMAFYLPQMHPIPENDAWWGKGFTEWTNVSKAVPRFSQHYQPRLPGELGYYDLRCLPVMEQQVELAKIYGLYGFCFYYYWFDGKRLLEKPLDLFLENRHLDLNFCICWANENWTRRWDGLESDVLISQTYSDPDIRAIAQDWMKYFSDERYTKVDGKPVLLIYRPDLIPNFADVSALWRQEARLAGFEGLYIVAASAFNGKRTNAAGLDATYDFPPHHLGAPRYSGPLEWLDPLAKTKTYSYEGAVEAAEADYGQKNEDEIPRHPGALVGWDTEPRKPGRGDVFVGSSPALFRRWLRAAFQKAAKTPAANRFIFINAWNEWAEGAYLEPDRRHGYAYLAALRSVVREFGIDSSAIKAFCADHNSAAPARTADKVVVLHCFYFDLVEEFARVIEEARRAAELDVFVSFPSIWSLAQVEAAIAILKPRKVYIVENHGRDVYPFLVAGREALADGYTFGCKIHSKKSTHRQDGGAWRLRLLEGLFSPEAFARLKSGMFGNSRVGLAAPAKSFMSLGVEEYIASNLDHMNALIRRFGLNPNFRRGEFVAGTMFWFRFDAMRGLFENACDENDFGFDLGQVDGTLAHAWERLFALYCTDKGWTTMKLP